MFLILFSPLNAFTNQSKKGIPLNFLKAIYYI